MVALVYQIRKESRLSLKIDSVSLHSYHGYVYAMLFCRWLRKVPRLVTNVQSYCIAQEIKILFGSGIVAAAIEVYARP